MTDYYSIPTTLGAAKIAAAANVNQTLTITHMAFGDANGLPYLPVTRANAITLVNERHRVTIEYLNIDSAANIYVTKARIPAAVGGFEINEIGLFDADGDLIYLANYPRTLKPQITQGAGGELVVKIRMMVSHSSVLTLVLDPHVITLTQANGDDRYALKTELDAEAIARANADLALSIALAAEITNRGNADTALNGFISSEAITRANDDNAEATARVNADLALSIALAAEITNRENADTALNGFISAEATARTNDDNAEATARANADLALSIAIAAEITARENAELRILKRAWPIGSVYENEVDLRNPAHADLLGFGTWEATQVGLFSAGKASGYVDFDFDTLGHTGGARGHKMTLGNLIEHEHDINLPSAGNGGTLGGFATDGYNDGVTDYTTAITGSSDPDPIPTLPPYVVSAKWRRTA